MVLWVVGLAYRKELRSLHLPPATIVLTLLNNLLQACYCPYEAKNTAMCEFRRLLYKLVACRVHEFRARFLNEAFSYEFDCLGIRSVFR